MGQPFSVRIQVRAYEVDRQGHLNQAVYTQYAEHARWQFLQAAGLTPDVLAAAGVGPVLLKAGIRFQRELRAGDEVDVGCAVTGGRGKLLELLQGFHTPDQVSVARVEATIGLLDLSTRRLLADPGATLRELAGTPEVLGLDAPAERVGAP